MGRSRSNTGSPVELARERVGAFGERVRAIRHKLHEVVVGQDTTIDQVGLAAAAAPCEPSSSG